MLTASQDVWGGDLCGARAALHRVGVEQHPRQRDSPKLLQMLANISLGAKLRLRTAAPDPTSRLQEAREGTADKLKSPGGAGRQIWNVRRCPQPGHQEESRRTDGEAGDPAWSLAGGDEWGPVDGDWRGHCYRTS